MYQAVHPAVELPEGYPICPPDKGVLVLMENRVSTHKIGKCANVVPAEFF
jgi:hypothetical protein